MVDGEHTETEQNTLHIDTTHGSWRDQFRAVFGAGTERVVDIERVEMDLDDGDAVVFEADGGTIEARPDTELQEEA